jgi:type IV pilus assembly protein PilY1
MTTMRKFLTSLAGASALLFSGAALPQFDPVGDDTDIFLANPLIEATRPNVLIMIDNTANWNQPFDVEKSALVNTVNNLVTEAFNVGLAMFVETGGDNDSIDGAYIRFGVRQMTPTNKARFVSMVTALDQLGDKSNNAVYSLAMDELFRYFAGKTSNSTFGKAKRDYPGNIDYNPLAADLPGWPFDDKTSNTLISPIVSGCQKNFIIFISNGKANDNSSSLSEAQGYLSAITGKTPPDTINLAPKPAGEQGLWSDEYAKHMASSDCAPAIDGVQTVITYTIDVLPGVAGTPDHTALLQSMADSGKGRYFAINDTNNSTELENALRQIFQEVQAVNSVFASVALPVSVNVRGTNLNQVYIGQFRPESGRGPRWVGNLKMYKIGQDTQGNAFLVDSAGLRAENAATGFVSPNAQSFWSATSNFWSHRPVDENGAGGESDLPDGDLVEKGGAAQGLRAKYPTDQAQRQVYTCVSGSGLCAAGSLLSASPFTVGNANVTGADLGTYSKKLVVGITSALAGTTPTATATVTAHGWSTNDVVKIDGASPNTYNQTAAITVVDANTFTYVLPSLPAANVARAVGTSHNLVSGDLVDVTGATPVQYNVADASITRIDANNFEYTMSGSSTTGSAGHSVLGKKLVTSATGVGTSAQATVTGHGYGAAGATVSGVIISGANEVAFNYPSPGATVTIVDANSFTYTTLLPITGTANTARASTGTVNKHGFNTGQTVTVSGSSEPLFNGSFLITKIDDFNFSYTVSGSAATASNVGIVASIAISQITHPTTGAGGVRDVATVTTSSAHGFEAGQQILISNTGGSPPAGYDGTHTIGTVVPGVSFTITHASIDGSPTPKTTAGMLAGKAITQIQPVVQASGTIRSGRVISGVTSLSSKANATGVINAGRPVDVDATQRDSLIVWARGRDNAENEKGNTTAPDVRPSTHGDVLHSRPAVVNYGRDGTENDVSIFYGTNDGGLRVVKGGTAAVSGDLHPDGSAVQPGDERWSFIPKEHFGKLERLRQRKPEISSDNPRNYFVDGAISAFTKDANDDGKLVAGDGDKVILYLAMRRGGDFLYALDASDPGAPTFLWRKQAGDTGYGELGQTWSEAKVGRIHANTRPSESTSSNPDNLVLIMGAGYDPAVEDPNPCLIDRHDATSIRKVAVGDGFVTYTSSGTCTVTGATGSSSTVLRSKGRGILVVDALDGHVIWQAGPNPTGATHNLTVADMTYAIPSDVRAADLNGDGFIDSMFVGDTGGNVWRVDIGDADPANWKVRKLATLASTSTTDIPNKRRFLFAPEVAFAEDALGVHLAVLLGAGDREHPFDGIVANTFYMLKDRGEAETRGSAGSITRSWVGTTLTPSAGGGGGAVAGGVIREADLQDVSSTPGATDSGWRLALRPGEKTVSSALVVVGVAIFSTNQPTVLAGTAVDACASNLGVARIYTIGAADASAVSDADNSGGVTLSDRSVIRAGGGYVPSPVYAAIQIGSGTPSTIPSSSQGTCVGAACGDTTTAGGGTPPTATTGIVCTGTTCWSVGTIDIGSRRRSYWYKEID